MLVVVIPLPLPIISCPAVLEILACFPSNAVCNPVVLAIVNAGIFDSAKFMSILLVPVLFVKCVALNIPIRFADVGVAGIVGLLIKLL